MDFVKKMTSYSSQTNINYFKNFVFCHDRPMSKGCHDKSFSLIVAKSLQFCFNINKFAMIKNIFPMANKYPKLLCWFFIPNYD